MELWERHVTGLIGFWAGSIDVILVASVCPHQPLWDVCGPTVHALLHSWVFSRQCEICLWSSLHRKLCVALLPLWVPKEALFRGCVGRLWLHSHFTAVCGFCLAGCQWQTCSTPPAKAPLPLTILYLTLDRLLFPTLGTQSRQGIGNHTTCLPGLLTKGPKVRVSVPVPSWPSHPASWSRASLRSYGLGRRES